MENHILTREQLNLFPLGIHIYSQIQGSTTLLSRIANNTNAPIAQLSELLFATTTALWEALYYYSSVWK